MFALVPAHAGRLSNRHGVMELAESSSSVREGLALIGFGKVQARWADVCVGMGASTVVFCLAMRRMGVPHGLEDIASKLVSICPQGLSQARMPLTEPGLSGNSKLRTPKLLMFLLFFIDL